MQGDLSLMYLLLYHCRSMFNICHYFILVSEDILTNQIRPALKGTLSDGDVRAWAEVNFLCSRVLVKSYEKLKHLKKL